VVKVINHLESLGVKTAYREIIITENPGECPTLDPEQEAWKHASEYTLENLAEHPRIKSYRKTLWSFKIDPTKTRPSPEALLRRLLRTHRFPRVNCAVDMVNLASLKYIVCIGLYDADKLPSDTIEVKLAEGGEEFHPIGGKPYKIKQGTPIAVSGDTVIHLYPSRDSMETSVDHSSSHLTAIAYGHIGDDPSVLRDSLSYYRELLHKCGCLAVKHDS